MTTRAVGTGAAVGAIVGGVFLGLAIASPDQHEKGARVAGAGVLTVVATGIGTAIGAIASLTHTETWVPASNRPPFPCGDQRPDEGRYATSTST